MKDILLSKMISILDQKTANLQTKEQVEEVLRWIAEEFEPFVAMYMGDKKQL